MSGAVTKVWDIGGTAFTTASNFKSLIEAVTVENVQPQAVLAAETLGSGIQVRDELLDKAIGVLKGNENLRWRNLKLSIGIRSGSLHQTIRTSTPLLSFFLFACAWKPCFTDSEIGDLAFRMIVDSGIIRSRPVSSFQLGDLIKSFSGHSELLNPAGLMHSLAVQINMHVPDGPQFYRRVTMQKLGDLLVRSFELLNDGSVDSITISGGTGGIWLATFFSWLLPGEVSISIDGRRLPEFSIDGEILTCKIRDSKLSLELISSYNTATYTDNWIIRDWRKGQPSTFVVEEEEPQVSQCKFMPLTMTKDFLNQLYISQYKGTLRASAESAIGELASALIILLSRYGFLCEPEECCKNLDRSCATSRLWDIFPTKWLKRYTSVITEYGWSQTTVQGQQKALNVLEPAYQRLSRLADPELAWGRFAAMASQFIASKLGNCLGEDKDKEEREELISRIFEPAVYVAVNAVATSVCDFRSGTQRIRPPSEVRSDSAKLFFGSLLSLKGMEISKFREFSFTRALPGDTAFDADDIAITSNGYTAGISILWNFNMQKRNALALRVCVGGIRREYFRYDSIKEVDASTISRFHRGDLERIKPFQGEEYLGLHPRADQHNLRVEHLIAEAGRRLELRSYLAGPEGYSNPVSWRRSIQGLAIMMHSNQTTMLTQRQEAELARRHEAIFGAVYWQSVDQWGHEDFESKTIIASSGNEELRFFSCGIVHNERQYYVPKKCFQIVLRHSASLLSTILAAQDKSEAWVIIC